VKDGLIDSLIPYWLVFCVESEPTPSVTTERLIQPSSDRETYARTGRSRPSPTHARGSDRAISSITAAAWAVSKQETNKERRSQPQLSW